MAFSYMGICNNGQSCSFMLQVEKVPPAKIMQGIDAKIYAILPNDRWLN